MEVIGGTPGKLLNNTYKVKFSRITLQDKHNICTLSVKNLEYNLFSLAGKQTRKAW